MQLAWRLRALIATGRLAGGERLPSFRAPGGLGGRQRQHREGRLEALEREELIVSHQGQGTFVAAGVAAAPQLEEIASDAVERARAAGLDPRELAIVATACATMPPPAEAGAAAEALAGP